MHISLDGFVAGPKGEMNWIKIDDELFDHVEKRIYLGDTALYGRVTFQMMEAYWPSAADKPNPTKHDIAHSKWYKNAHKIVLSRILREEDFSNTRVISDDFVGQLTEIRQSGDGEDGEILLFGSPTATHALMKQNLIDGYWLFVNPVILGRGIPLFQDIRDQINLSLVSTRQFASGVTELNYVVDRQ
jgi:dihydrofolate reductase